MKRLALAFAAIVGFSAAAAAQPLVDAAWIKENGAKPGVVLLDVTPPAMYAAAHIPGAVNTDFEKGGWRVEKNKVPDMMNDPEKLEAIIGGLGIGNDSHVVLIPMGASAADMGVGTRIYWTFKMLGHDKVSILDGGMKAWAADKQNPLQSGVNAPSPKAFKAGALRTELLATKEEVAEALRKGTLLVDSRPEDQYVGVNRNPKAKRNGTLPGAKNVPNSWMTENNGGKFRDLATIRKLYAAVSVPTDGEQITFCNTGHLASVGWFVAHELLGNTKVRMYDGSMVEWTADETAPVEQKIKM